MSAARAFRLACHGAVVAWAAALFVSAHLDPVMAFASDVPAEPIARVRPVPEPPFVEAAQLEPSPDPEPVSDPGESQPDPDPEPAPVAAAHVRASDLSRGAELLGGGDFPVLSCSYESFPSFRAYARAMVSLGARFVVVRQREIIGSVDVDTGAMGEPALDAVFSPRARDYTGEPTLVSLAARARARFGAGAVVRMLVPRELDAGLFGGIARVLAERGDHHRAYREIRGRYERAPGGVRLRLDAGVRPDGTRVEMNLVFDLGAIATVAGAPA